MRSLKDNKKSQEFSITILVVLVIAIIILVLVVLGFWKGWDYIFSKLGLLPNDLTATASACKTYAGSEALTTAFCEYKTLTINGVKGLWNCNGILVEASKSSAAVGYTESSKCVNEDTYCGKINVVSGFKETKVNGQTCSPVAVPAA